MAESEELKRLLMKVKEESEKVGLKLNIQTLEAAQGAPRDPRRDSRAQSLLKLMSIELVMLSNHLILCCPLLLLSSIFPSITAHRGRPQTTSTCKIPQTRQLSDRRLLLTSSEGWKVGDQGSSIAGVW